jgi:hypothetical protein
MPKPGGDKDAMHATVTRLRFESDEGIAAAAAALRTMIAGLPKTVGIRDCYVVEAGARELILLTVYTSAADANATSASMRPAIAAAVGPLVAGPPSRSEGRVLFRRSFD